MKMIFTFIAVAITSLLFVKCIGNKEELDRYGKTAPATIFKIERELSEAKGATAPRSMAYFRFLTTDGELIEWKEVAKSDTEVNKCYEILYLERNPKVNRINLRKEVSCEVKSEEEVTEEGLEEAVEEVENTDSESDIDSEIEEIIEQTEEDSEAIMDSI